MTEAVTISIVSGSASLCGVLVSTYFSYKAKVTAQSTHVAVNSRMEEFLKTVRTESYAKGLLKGKSTRRRK